jgi:hypothetical protein
VCPLLGLDTRKAPAVPSGGRWPPSWKVSSDNDFLAQFSLSENPVFRELAISARRGVEFAGPMDRFSSDREALDFIASRISDEAQREGMALSEVERKMLYFSETAWTLPDIMDVSDEFDRNYDQNAYERKISQLIKKAISRARKQQPDECDAWHDAIRRLSGDDRYLLVMAEQAGLGVTFRPPRLPRPRGDFLRLWITALVVVVLLVGFVWFVNLIFPNRNPPPFGRGRNDNVGFAVWIAMVCIAVLGTIIRFLIGARKFDDIMARALEWIFGVSKRGRNTPAE